jgi:CRISPR/Cas system-associated exonuclease Cas4 (RecB family)
MNNRPHWSYSAISQFLACPLCYYFQRVIGLPATTVSSGLVLGSAVHHALAEYHRGIQARQPVNKDHLHDALVKGWEHREAEGTVIFKSGESKDDSIAQGVALVDAYLQEPPPENIMQVEQEIIAPMHNSQGEYLETPLVAVADLITTVSDGLKVHEFKTSGRAYSEIEADTSLQPTCYVNAVQEAFGESARVEYTVLVKTRTPKVQRLEAVRHEEDLGRLGDIVQTIERAVQAGVFYPVESPLNCSSCPYRQPCREWGRSTRIPLKMVSSHEGEPC